LSRPKAKSARKARQRRWVALGGSGLSSLPSASEPSVVSRYGGWPLMPI